MNTIKFLNPFIAINGFQSARQVQRYLSQISFAPELKHLVGVGVHANSRSLLGGHHENPNYWPAPEEIKTIFPANTSTINILHFQSDFTDAANLYAQLRELPSLGGPNLHAVQLRTSNMPEPMQLRRFKEVSRLNLILEFGNEVLDEIDPADFAKQATSQYNGVADYLLLDTGRHPGMLLRPITTISYFHALKRAKAQFGLGTMGGLCDQTVSDRLPSIAELFQDFSVCADIRAMRKDTDELDLQKVMSFYKLTTTIFQSALEAAAKKPAEQST